MTRTLSILVSAIFAFTSHVVAANLSSVTIILKDGQTLSGRVVDIRGPSLEVGLGLGRRIIAKRDVDRWALNLPEGKLNIQQLLMMKSGHEVAGDIRYDSFNRQYIVTLDSGVAKYASRDVLRIVLPSGRASDETFSPRATFEKQVRLAIANLKSDSKSSQRSGRDMLEKAGFFALQFIDAEIASNGDPTQRLSAVATRERVRMSIPRVLIESDENYMQRLLEGKESARLDVLRAAFLELGPELYDLFGVLLLDPSQPSSMRSYCIDVLQRAHRYRELVDAYSSSMGSAQFVLAVALGDAGIYVGLETLIDSLEITGVHMKTAGGEDLELREYAAKKLEEYTGERFGFSIAKPVEENQVAIQAWRDWWKERQPDIMAELQQQMDPVDENPKRVRSASMWSEAKRHWQKGEIELAKHMLLRAVEEDSTAMPPYVFMGILEYRELGNFEAGRDWLLRSLKRKAVKGDDEVLRLAYYHLGRISESGFDYLTARSFYQKALDVDPNYADAWIDLGMAIYRQALGASKASLAVRKNLFNSSQQTFKTGLNRLQKFREGLRLLTRDNLPIGTDLPFSSRTHNKDLTDLRRRLRQTEARFCYQIAVIHFALGEREETRTWVDKALTGPRPSVDYYYLSSQVLKQLGEHEKAKLQIKKAMEIDPTDKRLKKESRN